MTIWIDPPVWPRHGRLFAHLVSDTSYAELHAFARRCGVPARAFDGDHYDVPEEWHDRLVAAGAVAVDSRDLVRTLRASGLRIQKRRGDTAVARIPGVSFPDGTVADVDLIASDRVLDVPGVFAAMVFVQDGAGHFALVHSIRREEWGSPGGWREPGESPGATAVRETLEETGLRLSPEDLVPCGYERFVVRAGHGARWLPGRSHLQVFRTRIDPVRPPLVALEGEVSACRWAGPGELRSLCEGLFWWPLAAHLFQLA